MNKLSIRAVNAFISVADCGSFTKAAAATGVSKANLSQLVSELEAQLGVQLLYRTTRKLRLSEVGKGYLEQCKQGMKQLESAAEWATQTTHTLKGLIRVNTVGGPLGEEVIAPLLFAFQREHPEVRIQLDFSSTRVDLIEQQYDLVIRMGDMPDSSLIVRNLHHTRTRYVASPAFLGAHPSIRQPEDLKDLPLVSGSVDTWIMNKAKDQRVIQATGATKIISGRAMRLAALSGLGVARLGDLYVNRDIAKGDLVEVLPEWSELTALSLVCPPTRHRLARINRLMDWLKTHFAGHYDYYMAHQQAKPLPPKKPH